jgi:hypothetical protein
MYSSDPSQQSQIPSLTNPLLIIKGSTLAFSQINSYKEQADVPGSSCS